MDFLQSSKENKITVSVVIPFYNEADNIDAVCSEICSVLEKEMTCEWEAILVNDGSKDMTGILIDKWAQNKNFRAVHLRKNMGQSAALFAGFRSAAGSFIFTLDGDGQNDPADIPVLFRKMQEYGVDMICGIRTRRNDNIIRKISSRIANRVRSLMLGDSISDVGCSSRGFRKECLDGFRFFRNAHRFFPALVQMAGFRVAEVPVNHRPRNKGESKYGAGINSRLWVGIADLFGVYWMKKTYINPEYFENTQKMKETPVVHIASGR